MAYLHGCERIDALDSLILGKRVGLITNHTGLDKDLRSTADLFSERYRLCALYAPEHGIRGDLQAGGRVDSYIDEKTQIPVYSMYKISLDDDIFRGVDVIVYDIQDVGVRFYTYIYALTEAIERAARLGKKVIVLDRYNPLGLIKTEGAILDSRLWSGVGRFALPARYALTVGELARYVNGEFSFGCELEILSCGALSRNDDYRTLGLDWVAPSPNLPSYESALAYVGTVLFEGTNISEGRGTTKPFEVFGAPWLRTDEVKKYIEGLGMKGFKLRECYFTPTFSKYKGELCRGLQIHISDPDIFEPFSLGLYILDYIRKTHNELQIRDSQSERAFLNLLLGTDEFMRNNFNAEEFLERKKRELSAFESVVRSYYLY
ncbi:MAG: DUF1343 domain-containing protein [Clostridia bacterium]|nr:DUF1343 domain-containing protein [Clostridia bacterium]